MSAALVVTMRCFTGEVEKEVIGEIVMAFLGVEVVTPLRRMVRPVPDCAKA